jgi:hypothetical protein
MTEHDYSIYMEDFDVYENNKDICICDKSMPLHYAIVSQILGMDNNTIPVIKNYSCLYCYNNIKANNRVDDDENKNQIIKEIIHSNPPNILEVKNKYGDTPFDIITNILQILKFEGDNPYNKSYTDREIRYYINMLEDIEIMLQNIIK